jgi:hypothetical protein
MKKTTCPKCKGKGCSHCGGKGYHTGMAKGGMMKKKMNPGMAALKKEAPAVAAKMGYMYGGMTEKKNKMGYAHGGSVEKANCGASMKPNRKAKS